MERYKNLGGDSRVVSYAIDADAIQLMFKDGWLYTYDESSAGASHLAKMKELAHLGQGLNTYVNREVKDSYAFRRRT
jgi:hypothetical protein